jgi:hypothetical protein
MGTITIEYKIGLSSGIKEVALEDNWVEQCYKFDNLFTSWRVL